MKNRRSGCLKSSLKSDLFKLIQLLKEQPDCGTPIGHSCYKIRLSIKSKGKGKRGGGRIITCVKIEKKKVFLLSIFDKSERATITDKELKDLLKYIPE